MYYDAAINRRTDAAYKIVHLLLIVDTNVRHVSYTSSVIALPEIGQEILTFRPIIIDGYGHLEEAIVPRQYLPKRTRHQNFDGRIVVESK